MSGLRVQNAELAELGLTLPGFVERKHVIASLPSLGLLTLAALTPRDIHVSYVDVDVYEDGDDLPGEFDVVAISSFTAQINSAYQLADQYRSIGTRVILGGLHVTSLPDEAMEHADAIVIGEGELCWNTVIHDLKHNRLEKIYDARGGEYNLTDAPIPAYELLDMEKYNRVTVQTQRGCPYQCEFCAASIMLTKKYKAKPVSKVVDEINKIKSIWDRPFIEFADDNSFSHKRHARELVSAIAPLHVKWFTETDISVAEDDELLMMLTDSGCRQLLIGFESPVQAGLHHLEMKANWKERQLDRYKEAIHNIQSRGISVNGCFILGLDGHTPEIFDETLNFVNDSGLSEVQITIQTPFPNTPLYQRLKAERRLIEAVYWDKCTLFDVTYYPKHMTVDELERGFLQLMQDIYHDDRVKARKKHFIKARRAMWHGI